MIHDDLTDDEVAEMAGDGTATHLNFVRAALELQRHRAARAADEERLASAIRVALHDGEMATIQERMDGALDLIARRAAKQLASPGLSLEERDDLGALLSSLNEQREAAIGFGQHATADMFRGQHAALSKLLGRSAP